MGMTAVYETRGLDKSATAPLNDTGFSRQTPGSRPRAARSLMATTFTLRSSGIHLIDPRDDVGVATRALEPGETIADGVEVREVIPRGHKVALRQIGAGQEVHKYGWPIGRARCDIAAGSLVHTLNLATQLSGLTSYEYRPAVSGAPDRQDGTEGQHHAAAPQFMGYRRANGRVGTRNEIWVLTTVGCVTRTAQRIARLGAERFAGRLDGVHAFTHPFGCSQIGDDLSRTRRILASLIAHPNAGGVLVVGLGCESNQLDRLLAEAGPVDPARIRSFCAQTAEDEEQAGLQALEELVGVAQHDVREQCPLSALSIGLKCGGSDGLSGITANPLVGSVADRIAAAGGTPILTEIPEVFGAEHMLLQRAIDRRVFDEVVGVVNRFKQYFLDHGQPIYENPSPGNIAGGITTLEEKSLGAVQKSGRTQVTQVLDYGDRARVPGLALLESPGNDAVSSTALVAAGATLLLFTTGRGTPLGFPVPTLKIASNSALAEKKPRWIDFDAGRVLSGMSTAAAAKELLQLVIETASGKPARNELNDEREVAIWKSGVTL